MTTIVYTTTTCPYCKMLKNYFAEKGVKFDEKLVDQNDEARAEMMQASGGFLGVPFTVIDKEDGTKETVVGFDKNRFNEILGLSDQV